MPCTQHQKALIKSVRAGKLAQLQSRIESIEDVNTHDSSGATLLHHALRAGHMNIAQYLCDNGCDVEARDDNGRHPMHEVASHGTEQGVELLLSHDSEVDCLKHADWTPLMIACTTTNINVIRALIGAGANLQLYNKDGWTPLHLACRVGDVQIVRYLLDQYEGADADVWNRAAHNGRTPLHTTAAHGHVNILQVLFKEISKQRSGDDLSCVVNVRDSSGNTPLMCAVTSRSVDTVEFFCKEYKDVCSVDARDKIGRQALHIACLINATEIARVLIECEADVNARDNKKTTPLQLAAREGHMDILVLLLGTKTCDIAAEDSYSQTAASDALKFGRMDAYKHLITGREEVTEGEEVT